MVLVYALCLIGIGTLGALIYMYKKRTSQRQKEKPPLSVIKPVTSDRLFVINYVPVWTVFF